MLSYKLLTPGPLSTTESVKREMLVDHCTWDDDYKRITQKIRSELLTIGHCPETDYTAVLMQGSGTFGVESVLTSAIAPEDKLLICANGSYGLRQAQICRHAGIAHTLYECPFDRIPDAAEVARLLAEDPAITHVSIVHSETTSGILNDIAAVARVVKAAGKTYIVDAVSSFGGVDIDLPALGIDFLISTSNKCIQGVPGFAFILAKKSALLACKGRARSLSLDLSDQWDTMEHDGGKWRYTSPTHVVLAFSRALDEFFAEGGVPARGARYAANRDLLIERMTALGFTTYIPAEHQGPIIVTFFYPEGETIDFGSMYDYIKARGYAIYPGKLTDADTFRIGVIGEIYPADIEVVTGIFADYLAAHRRGEVR